MNNNLRYIDLTNFTLPGETTHRFEKAVLPPDKGIPFALIHLSDSSPIRMDLDKKVFLDQVVDSTLSSSSAAVAEYIISKETSTPIIPPVALEIIIKQAAEKFSLMRKAERIFWEYQNKLEHLKTCPSSKDEMLRDWVEGATFVSLQIIEGNSMSISDLNPKSFKYLEESWLRDVKKLKAFYVWKADRDANQEKNYSNASQSIRKLLINKKRAPLEKFYSIKKHIKNHYLQDGEKNRLDDSKTWTKMMVARKAERIWLMRLDDNTYGDNSDSEANWFRARLYIAMFYENIIGAIVDNDKEKTLNILRAFEFSKSPDNRYLIINAFEAAIAIEFLNKEIIQEVLNNPDLYTFNLEPVDSWPDKIQTDQLCYNSSDKELTYTGVMTAKERDRLKNIITDSQQKLIIDRLYHQSHMHPYQAQVL